MPSFVVPSPSPPARDSTAEFVTDAVKDKLADTGKTGPERWMAAFGKLRHLRKETARINRLIEEEFENVEAADCL
jgi:hypothetical protein